MLPGGDSITLALAVATRMGGIPASGVASALMERLEPGCLAMSGVCAGNRADLALGDVVIAQTVFQYDEGKQTDKGFQGDLFPTPMESRFVRQAGELLPAGRSGEKPRDIMAMC
jgi:nucleoside phosphorylase